MNESLGHVFAADWGGHTEGDWISIKGVFGGLCKTPAVNPWSRSVQNWFEIGSWKHVEELRQGERYSCSDNEIVTWSVKLKDHIKREQQKTETKRETKIRPLQVRTEHWKKRDSFSIRKEVTKKKRKPVEWGEHGREMCRSHLGEVVSRRKGWLITQSTQVTQGKEDWRYFEFFRTIISVSTWEGHWNQVAEV